MIDLRGSQPPSKAILQQDFVASLLLILIGIGSRGHLAALRRSAGSGPIGSARRQIVMAPGADNRPSSPKLSGAGLGMRAHAQRSSRRGRSAFGQRQSVGRADTALPERVLRRPGPLRLKSASIAGAPDDEIPDSAD